MHFEPLVWPNHVKNRRVMGIESIILLHYSLLDSNQDALASILRKSSVIQILIPFMVDGDGQKSSGTRTISLKLILQKPHIAVYFKSHQALQLSSSLSDIPWWIHCFGRLSCPCIMERGCQVKMNSSQKRVGMSSVSVPRRRNRHSICKSGVS